MRPRSPAALLTLSIAGLIGYVIVAKAVSRQRTAADDRKVRDDVQKAREPEVEPVAEVVGPLGKEWLHVPVAAILSAFLFRRGAGTRAIAPLLASVASDTASRVCDRLPPNRKPPPGHPHQQKPSFPSGHANETTAVALTSAYVLTREGLVAPAPAFAVAIVMAIASPASRLYLDRHWIIDVVGGWCIGLSIAATCAAIYESNVPDPAYRGGSVPPSASVFILATAR
jgi:membrane-associated phospholipid phosphatase